jgi:1,4-alpha-glucan branching enzyme
MEILRRDRIKLVYVLSDSPIKPCGGLGERLRKLLPMIKEHCDVFIYCAGEGGVYEGIEVKAIDIECPDYGNPYPFFYTNFVLDNPPPFSPDVVIATDYGTIMAAKALASIHGAKLVTEFHLAYYSLKKAIKEHELVGEMKLDQAARLVYLIEQIGATSSDLVIGCSTNYVNDLPWETKRAVAIQNGIDAEKYKGEHKPFKFEGGKKRNLVFIGRMNTQKGIKYLFDYYAVHEGRRRYLARIPDSERLILPEDTALHFVGGPIGGDQWDSMLETVKNSDQKFHIPFVSGQEKIDLLKSADAIIFPSVHEPFGIVGLEAFAAGVPLITSMVDGIADYANESNSIKCELSSAGVRSAIDRLFSMPESERRAMIENGFETAERFNWKDIAEQFILELRSLTNGDDLRTS